VAVVPFAGLELELETFLERVPVSESGAALERWRELEREGWDVSALTYDAGGVVLELVGLGCRYAPAEGATLSRVKVPRQT
jgi:hypothetical protein